VWVMNSDGSHISHLFRASGGAQSIVGLFAWSPDGKSIAYERLADSPIPFLPAGLWTMNSTGGQQQLLANIDGGHGYLPVWSPDSHKLAYVVRTNFGDHLADVQMQSLQCAIAAIDVTTRQSWNVASPNQTGMQLNMHPMWSANSANITFTAANPFNMVIGGMPRYWIARAVGSQSQPSLSTLTPAILNVVAIG
jgi:Tol biopolymer transport system component